MKLSKDENLIAELVVLVETAKNQVVVYANSTMTMLFWQIGQKVRLGILGEQRAKYGEQIVVTVSRELVERFGKNYEVKNLRRMIQFSEEYPDYENVVTLSRHLSWSHFFSAYTNP